MQKNGGDQVSTVDERMEKIIRDINPEIISYQGDNLFDAGILDSFVLIDLIAAIEEEFHIDIDARYILQDNFVNKDKISELIKKFVVE